MGAVAATCPHQAWYTNAACPLPQQVLQFDGVGSIQYCRDDNVWLIRAVEVKAKLEYKTAVRQLGLRLKVLEWLARLHLGDDVDIKLVGALCFPTYGRAPPPVDKSMVTEAKRVWNFKLELVPSAV